MFQPQYTISHTTLEYISNISKKLAELNLLTIPQELLRHIRKQCRLALTHFSTEIEGNKLSQEEVIEVIEHHKTFGLKRDELEVRNYFTLLEKLPIYCKKYTGKLSKELILLFHSQCMKDIVEDDFLHTYRTTQNAIYDAQTSKLVYLPPEAKDVMQLMEDLCEWINTSDINPFILSSIFHNQSVTIHPFIDGNGRVARIISLYILYSRGYNLCNIIPIDRYYATDRARYYLMLQLNYSHNYYFGRNNTNFTPWIEYYLEGIYETLAATLNQVETCTIENILFNNRQDKTIQLLRKKKFITASEYAKMFFISTRMATRDLCQLVQWKKVVVIGKGRATKYILLLK